MGKTTNALLTAGEMALETGRVDIEALRTLHLGTCDDFDLPDHTRREVGRLLDECQDMLNGVRLLQELSPRSLDQLVSYGERCSVRIVAARLNQIGVPAQAFDAWDVGVFTDDTFGDAKLLPTAIDSIRERFERRVDPNVVAVVTGFIGESYWSVRVLIAVDPVDELIGVAQEFASSHKTTLCIRHPTIASLMMCIPFLALRFVRNRDIQGTTSMAE
jgi:aspartokinase